MTTTEDITVVISTAEKIKNDELQRFPEAASVGDYVRQGDIYIIFLDCVPSDAIRVATPQLQLAPGSSQGSRHCLSTLDGVDIYSLPDPTVYDGPVIRCTTEVTVTHPEHGNWLLPVGCYAISYQRTEDDKGRQRRVRD